MEPVAEIGAAEVGVSLAVEGGEFLLRCHGFKGVHRVVVDHFADDLGGRYRFPGVEGDAVVVPRAEALQVVHVVGDHGRKRLWNGGFVAVVPRGPGPAVFGQEGRVPVEHRVVCRVAPRAEKARLLGRRVCQEPVCLVGMGGDDDGIEGFLGSVGKFHGNAGTGSPDCRDGAFGPHRPLEGLEKGLDVRVASARDIVPGRRVPEGQQAVVRVEAGEGFHGEFHRLGLRGGPDGRGHGDDELFDDVLPEALAFGELAEGEAAQPAALELIQRSGAEAPDPEQESPVGRPEKVCALGEEAVEPEAAVLQARRIVLAAEGHIRLRCRNPQLPEEGPEERVGPLVVDDEARVDGQTRVGAVPDDGRVRVAADVVVFLEESDLVPAVQKIGGHDAGNTGADDGDVHTRLRHHGLCLLERLGEVRLQEQANWSAGNMIRMAILSIEIMF